MKLIENITLEGERPLYSSHDIEMKNITIGAGESAVKESSNIVANGCRFEGKYPLWRIKKLQVNDCLFTEGGRAGIWYSDDITMENCMYEAPKGFRDCNNVVVKNTKFTIAEEGFWHCKNIKLENCVVEGATYFLMNCENIEISGLHLTGNYTLQYAKNIVIRNSILNTKDAFWETDNCTVYDSTISGEYLAWHSRNLHLVRCHICGTQPLCYAEGLVLEDCTFGEDADLAFEYSDVQATVNSHIISVKNPHKGYIKAQSIGEIILDENQLKDSDCVISQDK